MMSWTNPRRKLIDLYSYSHRTVNMFRCRSYDLFYEIPCKISAVIVGVIFNGRGIYSILNNAHNRVQWFEMMRRKRGNKLREREKTRKRENKLIPVDCIYTPFNCYNWFIFYRDCSRSNIFLSHHRNKLYFRHGKRREVMK